MTHVRMHEDELDIDDALVRGLLRAQQPQWADLPLRRVVSSGTDNAMFRLGDDMVVRLPRIERAVAAARRTSSDGCRCSHPHLPLAVPSPLATGDAGHGYPWRWSVYSWIEGDNAFDGADRRHGRGSPRPGRVHRRAPARSTRRTHHRPVGDAEVLPSPSSINRRAEPSRPREASSTVAAVTAAWEAAMASAGAGIATRCGSMATSHAGNLLVHGGRIRRGHRLRQQRSRRSGVRPPRRLGSVRRALDAAVFRDSGERRRRHVGTGPRLGSVHGALGASVLPPHEPRDGRPSPTQARRSARGHALTWANTGDPPGMSHPLAMMST